MIKNLISHLGVWTIRHHWIFLLLIIGFQWLSGQVMLKPADWDWLMDTGLARKLHTLNSQLIFWLLIYMGLNKLWLWLKRSGKI